MKTKYLIHNSKGILGATFNQEVAECLARNCNASIEEIEILEESDLEKEKWGGIDDLCGDY